MTVILTYKSNYIKKKVQVANKATPFYILCIETALKIIRFSVQLFMVRGKVVPSHTTMDSRFVKNAINMITQVHTTSANRGILQGYICMLYIPFANTNFHVPITY